MLKRGKVCSRNFFCGKDGLKGLYIASFFVTLLKKEKKERNSLKTTEAKEKHRRRETPNEFQMYQSPSPEGGRRFLNVDEQFGSSKRRKVICFRPPYSSKSSLAVILGNDKVKFAYCSTIFNRENLSRRLRWHHAVSHLMAMAVTASAATSNPVPFANWF